MYALVAENVTRVFERVGGRIVGLDRFSLEVAPATIQVWLGQSGSGKSTAARCIAGQDQRYSGSILLNGESLEGVPAHLRSRRLGIYYVSQSPVLYPHLRVRGNVLFGLELLGLTRTDLEERVREAFQMAFPALAAETGDAGRERFMNKRVHQLSGGERQRVGLMKAMVRRPRLLILDEPLSNVDAPQRTEVRRSLIRWSRGHRITTIWITHDQHEAVAVASSIAIIDHGNVLQVGSPHELAGKPAHRQVAALVCAGLGTPMSFLPVDIAANGDGTLNLFCQGQAAFLKPSRPGVDACHEIAGAKEALAGLRADLLQISPTQIAGRGIEAEVVDLEPIAHGVAVICETSRGTVVCHVRPPPELTRGQRVALFVTEVPPLFDRASGRAFFGALRST